MDFFKNKDFKGYELYKFYWPFWTKKTLKIQYASNPTQEMLIDKILKLRTINSVIIIPFLGFWTIVVLVVALAL